MILLLILLVLLVLFLIWLTPAIIMAFAALGAILTGLVRGTKAGFKQAASQDIRPASPRIEAMRASSERMKAERLAKRAARRAKKGKA